LYEYDSSRPPAVEDVAPPTRQGAATVRDITYECAGDGRVSAWLVAPATGGARAAILYLHWLGEVNSNRNEFLSEAIAMAERGVVSLLPERLFPGVAAPADWRSDRRSIAAQTIELRRGLDLLLAQPGVGPEAIAFVGHDYGAMDGMVLATADDRLKAVVFLTPDADWATWFFKYFGLPPADEPEYRREMQDLDPVALLPRIARTPLFLQFSDADEYVSAEVIRQVTAAAGNANVKVYSNVGHGLVEDSVVADRMAWLAGQIGLAD